MSNNEIWISDADACNVVPKQDRVNEMDGGPFVVRSNCDNLYEGTNFLRILSRDEAI